MQPSFLIRPATPADGGGIAELFMRVWHISLANLLPEGFLERFDRAVQKEKYAARAADPGWILFVAEKDGRIAGMIGAKDNDTEPLAFEKQIKAMYVDPDFQGQRIGEALLRVLMETLKNRGAKNALLWCIARNRRAGLFYERHGGQKIGDVAPPEEYAAMPHVLYAWDL